jgi:hypothetical protein
MSKLDTQMYMALNTALMFIGQDITMKEMLGYATDAELQGMIFGWLAAKDMWHNDIDVNSFLKNLREEVNNG